MSRKKPSRPKDKRNKIIPYAEIAYLETIKKSRAGVEYKHYKPYLKRIDPKEYLAKRGITIANVTRK